MLWFLNHLRRAAWKALGHEVLTLSKAAAYSAILGLFPALLVGTTALALIPQTDSVMGEVSQTLSDFVPADMMSTIQMYFEAKHSRSIQVLISAIFVSLFGGMGVMTAFMDGFRRAYGLEKGSWNPWRERLLAIGLIPISLGPLVFATFLVVFGHQIETWIIENSTHTFQNYVLFIWRVVRWAIALATTSLVLAIVYRYGVPRPRKWRFVWPGAMGATAIWFLATLFYGWYVTRFADYTVVYGSLGTAVATLVWLYITCLSVFIGGELNAQMYPMTMLATAMKAEPMRENARPQAPDEQLSFPENSRAV